MADSTNLINIQVVDVVAPEIAPKLIAIADASDKCASSVGTLADAMATLKGSGIGTLGTLLAKLELGTLKAATAQSTLATQIRETTSAAVGQAAALGIDATALTSVAAATRAAMNAGKEKIAGDVASTAATKNVVSANISAAAGLGILEGRTLSMNRAAANFLTRILGLGPALQAAFVAIGAVAMVAVLYQMGEALNKFIDKALAAPGEIKKAFTEETLSIVRSNDELALVNDKLDESIAKLQHKPATNGLAIAIDEARVMADKLDDSLESISKKFDELAAKNQVGLIAGILTGQSSTSMLSAHIAQQFDAMTSGAESAAQSDMNDTLSAQYKTPQERQDAITQALKRGLVVRGDALREFAAQMATERKKYELEDHSDPHVASAIPGSEAAFNDYSGSITLANAALNKLDLTATNMDRNKSVDTLRDQISATSAAVKQAAKDWKSLEAAFISYETASEKAGHKPTAQESLSWLQSAKNNPLNADKLAAKEQPFESKITGDNDWIKEQSDRLANQVNEIGLYGNALKEAADMRTILQDAEKRGIVLTDQQIEAFKKQIATVVESAAYQKELENVYQAVDGAQQKLAASASAITNLWERGLITNEQHNQGITESIKLYNEATSAVTKFTNALDQQQRDASNKLGTQSHIAVQTTLQGLDSELRKPGADSQHPFGYSSSEIASVNASLAPLIAAQQHMNAVNEEANKLINAQDDMTDKRILQQQALAQAVAAGAVSQQQANLAMLQSQLAQNKQGVESGSNTSLKDIFSGAFGQFIQNYKGIASGIQSSFGAAFTTLADGFANSIGRWAEGTEKLSKALRDVARNVVGELISSLIKLGIQYLAVNVLMKAFNIKPLPSVSGPTPKAAAEGVAGMGLITAAGLIMTKLLDGPMWSLAGALAAVTFGASAAAGTAALATTVAASSAAGGHADGGFISGPGTARSDSVAAWLSNGEYVVNAGATSQNRDLLEAINSGASRETVSTRFAPQVNASPNGVPRSQMAVEVHNYNGSRVDVQQMDDNRVRLIVRDEAPSLVAKHAPGVIASQLNNPNSKVSKGVSNNTLATRRR